MTSPLSDDLGITETVPKKGAYVQSDFDIFKMKLPRYLAS
jgi:hypothetical protein